MSNTIVGLLGVVAGALVTGVLQLGRDLRTDRRQKRAAIRQIYADLRLAISRLKNVEDGKRLRVGTAPHTYDLPDTSWLEHGTVAAGLVKAELWRVLVSAVMGIRSTNRLFAAIRAEERPNCRVQDDELTEIRRVHAYLRYTLDQVEQLHSGRRPREKVEPQLVVLSADTPERLTAALPHLVRAFQPRGWTIATGPAITPTWTEITLAGPSWDDATTSVREAIAALGPNVARGLTVSRRHRRFDGL